MNADPHGGAAGVVVPWGMGQDGYFWGQDAEGRAYWWDQSLSQWILWPPLPDEPALHTHMHQHGLPASFPAAAANAHETTVIGTPPMPPHTHNTTAHINTPVSSFDRRASAPGAAPQQKGMRHWLQGLVTTLTSYIAHAPAEMADDVDMRDEAAQAAGDPATAAQPLAPAAQDPALQGGQEVGNPAPAVAVIGAPAAAGVAPANGGAAPAAGVAMGAVNLTPEQLAAAAAAAVPAVTEAILVGQGAPVNNVSVRYTYPLPERWTGTGKDKLRKPRTFLSDIESFSARTKQPPIDILLASTGGSMREYLNTVLSAQPSISWEELKKEFRLIAGDDLVSDETAARERLMGGGLVQTGALHEYILDFRTTMRDIPTMTEKDRIMWFLRGLGKSLRGLCARDDKGNEWSTLAALEQYALGMEKKVTDAASAAAAASRARLAAIDSGTPDFTPTHPANRPKDKHREKKRAYAAAFQPQNALMHGAGRGGGRGAGRGGGRGGYGGGRGRGAAGGGRGSPPGVQRSRAEQMKRQVAWGEKRCFKCLGFGHIQRDCPNNRGPGGGSGGAGGMMG